MHLPEEADVETHDLSHAAIPPAPRPAHVKSASRALDIIEGLAAEPNGLAFTELARRQAIPKSSLHALLTVLTDRGYVELDAERRTYGLGIRTWEIGQAWATQRSLVDLAIPIMERVVQEINETTQLAVLDGIENVYLAKVDCSHPIRLQSEVGKRLYAHGTGLGKVLLAAQTDEDLRARYAGIPFPQVESSPIRSFDHLLHVVADVRERGFAIDDQEYTPGLRCVAVPVYCGGHQVVAAISAAIPLMRAGPEQLANALRTIAASSIDLSRALGVTDPDPRLVGLTGWDGDVLATARDQMDRRGTGSQ
jgi:DNA-binding IclR family transcriptional regulator